MRDDGVGLGPTAAFERLRAVVAVRHPAADLDRLHDIAVMAADCHRGQHRRSGDQYVTHPLIVATLVTEWGRPMTCIQAAVLHDVVEGGWEPGILRGAVDDRVIDLIELAHRLDRDGPHALAEVECTLAQDALAIKLADRLHNARTWRFVPPAKARRKARETIELYAPAAVRAGLAEVGAELGRLADAQLSAPAGAPPPVEERRGLGRTSSPIMIWTLNRLPVNERERYAAEWAADLGMLRNRRERWVFHVGLLWSARRLR